MPRTARQMKITRMPSPHPPNKRRGCAKLGTPSYYIVESNPLTTFTLRKAALHHAFRRSLPLIDSPPPFRFSKPIPSRSFIGGGVGFCIIYGI